MQAERRDAGLETGRFGDLWFDEMAGADLYRALAQHADPGLSGQLLSLAESETEHADYWAGLLDEAGQPRPRYRRPFRVRVLVAAARLLGTRRVLPALVRMEVGEVQRYRDVAEAPEALVEQEVLHGRLVAGLRGATAIGAQIAAAEGRHRIAVGGPLRPAVFGANDGLVSNLALVMGVAGGTSDASFVLLAGVAGLVAGACSMAAGEWISVRSQTEVYERELEVERSEIRHFPDEEIEELELIYQAKGVGIDDARRLARQLMEDEEVALDVMAREELGIAPGELPSAWTAAVSSFVAFSVGALVPVVPYMIGGGAAAFAAAAAASGLSLFVVGALISVFTGRHPARSGLRMVAIGGGAAAVTFGVGTLIGTA